MLVRGNIHSMKLGAITSRAAQDPARRRSGLSEGDPGSQPVRPDRTDAARPAEERQKEAMDAAIAEYRRLSPLATGDLPSTPVARELPEGRFRCPNK
jgi:hypothetical protein